ncbi:peptidase M1 [Skermanella aerolata]|uniref:Peptidase M1 n=1 Tax=Skermanella aerolata TaxID=393310 RepID=A0A512DIK3_9PROT|nr:M1 family aminopeptidase [Skermanella aerolata]KJB97690.1 peptidase M1 [Skermanella aerolata KACC 11604]GEO36040.1 peptidase M1 [Skermanella aerolata]
MRTKLLCLALLAAVPGGGFCESAEAASTLRHKAEVRLEPTIRHIQVTDEIDLEATGETVRFRLSRLLRPSLVEVDGVRVTPSSGPEGWSVPTGGRGPKRLVIRYEGVLAELDSGGSPFGGTDPGSGEDGSYLPGGTAWLPGFDDPGLADYRVAITVPKGYRPVMTGRLEDEALGRAVFTFNGASEEPSLFAGRWNVRERMADGLRLRTYFEPDLERLSDDYLEASEGYIRRFSERIGQYPFDSFSILSAPLPVGLGFESLTYIGRQVLPLPFMRGQSLPHEILHNWWGNGVLVDYETGNWSEGLTTYMADYGLTEERSPEAAREMRLGWLRDVAALPPERDGTLADFKARVHGAAQIVGYNKSAYLFLMLNDLLGQDAFDRGIRLFWERHRFKRAGWAELRSAFEEASGTDLEAFFQQWVERRGALSVQLETITAKRVGDAYEMTVRIGQGQPFYRLAVPLMVETAAGTTGHHVEVTGPQTVATLKLDAEPRWITLDPDYRLFRRLAPGEAPPILRDVTLDPTTRMVFAGPEQDAARALAERLMDAGSRGGTVYRTSPVAVVGTTEAVVKALADQGLPPMPASLAGKGTARVWTARSDAGSTVLAIAADDKASLEALMRPLPHYGRQSFLVFQGREAVERGVWPSGDSPSRRAVKVD